MIAAGVIHVGGMAAPPKIAQDAEAIITAMHQWSDRKKARYQPHHIRLAWQRLREEQWAPQ